MVVAELAACAAKLHADQKWYYDQCAGVMSSSCRSIHILNDCVVPWRQTLRCHGASFNSWVENHEHWKYFNWGPDRMVREGNPFYLIRLRHVFRIIRRYFYLVGILKNPSFNFAIFLKSFLGSPEQILRWYWIQLYSILGWSSGKKRSFLVIFHKSSENWAQTREKKPWRKKTQWKYLVFGRSAGNLLARDWIGFLVEPIPQRNYSSSQPSCGLVMTLWCLYIHFF